MSDLIDKANERAAFDLEQAIAAHQAKQPAPGVGRADCEDCGEFIEPRRRQIIPDATRCACCAGMHELRNRNR